MGQIFCFSCFKLLRITKYTMNFNFKLFAHRNIVISKKILEYNIKLKSSVLYTTLIGLNLLHSHYVLMISEG